MDYRAGEYIDRLDIPKDDPRRAAVLAVCNLWMHSGRDGQCFEAWTDESAAYRSWEHWVIHLAHLDGVVLDMAAEYRRAVAVAEAAGERYDDIIADAMVEWADRYDCDLPYVYHQEYGQGSA